MNMYKYWNSVDKNCCVVLTSKSFTYYVINVYVPRVRANADHCLQHHQGCPETPKSADVICERPLNGCGGGVKIFLSAPSDIFAGPQ